MTTENLGCPDSETPSHSLAADVFLRQDPEDDEEDDDENGGKHKDDDDDDEDDEENGDGYSE